MHSHASQISTPECNTIEKSEARRTRGRTRTNLSLCQGTVDARGGLGRVSSKEGVLVNDKDVETVLEDGVGSRETREASSDDDDGVGHDGIYGGREGREKGG